MYKNIIRIAKEYKNDFCSQNLRLINNSTRSILGITYKSINLEYLDRPKYVWLCGTRR